MEDGRWCLWLFLSVFLSLSLTFSNVSNEVIKIISFIVYPQALKQLSQQEAKAYRDMHMPSIAVELGWTQSRIWQRETEGILSALDHREYWCSRTTLEL